MPALNNVTTSDDYTDATTVAAPGIVRVNIIVSGASIAYELAPATAGAPAFRPVEKFLAPGLYSLDRLCSGIRVRSWVKGVPAQVTIDALTEQELRA